MNQTLSNEKTSENPKVEADSSATTCSRLKDERKTALSKLSAMHDQYCHCMGRHPDSLYLTPYTAGILGWDEGFKTPFYATVVDTAEMQDTFSGDDPLRDIIIEECAMAVETQERGTRYQWQAESHFGTMAKEMANRLRRLKSSANANCPPTEERG